MKAIELAKLFHKTYEKLAPSFGYVTRKETRVKFEDLPTNNQNLMIATAEVILANLENPKLDETSKRAFEITENVKTSIEEKDLTQCVTCDVFLKLDAKNEIIEQQAEEIKMLKEVMIEYLVTEHLYPACGDHPDLIGYVTKADGEFCPAHKTKEEALEYLLSKH